MWPVLGGLITGGMNLLGGLFSSETSAQNTQAQIQAQEQMQGQSEQFNAAQAQINRDYQTQMSNTAYQRASQDMKAAGLNPMIMAGGGGGASSPSGSTASVGTPSVPVSQRTSPLAALGQAANSAVQTMIAGKEMDKMTEQTANTDLLNRFLERELKAGKPEIGVQATQQATAESVARENLRKQEFQIGAPEEDIAKRFGALPDWAKDAIGYARYGHAFTKNAAGMISDAVNVMPNSAISAFTRKFGNASPGLSPSQTRDLYDRFKAMDSQ